MNSSPLNPDAPVFVPGTVGGADVLLAESPRKPLPMDDIEVPDAGQFETEAEIRPAELLDLDNCDQLNGHHNIILHDTVKESFNGNENCNMDSLGFGFNVGIESDKVKDSSILQDFERIQKDTTDFCNIQVFQAHSESNPFASDENEVLFERLKNKERDPMSMSFYQEKDDDTCERLSKNESHVDLNAVQLLPDSDDEDIHTNGDLCENSNEIGKENIAPEHFGFVEKEIEEKEPNNDIMCERINATNLDSFGQGDNFTDNMQSYSHIDFESTNIPQETNIMQTDTPESHKLLFEQIPEIPDGKSSELGFTNEDIQDQNEIQKDARAFTPQAEMSNNINSESKLEISSEMPSEIIPINNEELIASEIVQANEDNENQKIALSPGPIDKNDNIELNSPELSQNIQDIVADIHQNYESEYEPSVLATDISNDIIVDKPEEIYHEHMNVDGIQDIKSEIDLPLELTPDLCVTESQPQLESEPVVAEFSETLIPSINVAAQSPLPIDSPLPVHSPLPTEFELIHSASPTGILETDLSLPPKSPLPADSLLPSESPLPADSPLPAESHQSLDSPRPSESLLPAESPLPTESPAPSESPMPIESSLPVESPLPVETHLLSGSPLPTESPLHTKSPLPTESPLPMESPFPTDCYPPAESSLPTESTLPMESVLPTEPCLRTQSHNTVNSVLHSASPLPDSKPPESPTPTMSPLPVDPHLSTELEQFESVKDKSPLPSVSPLPTESQWVESVQDSSQLPSNSPLPDELTMQTESQFLEGSISGKPSLSVDDIPESLSPTENVLLPDSVQETSQLPSESPLPGISPLPTASALPVESPLPEQTEPQMSVETDVPTISESHLSQSPLPAEIPLPQESPMPPEDLATSPIPTDSIAVDFAQTTIVDDQSQMNPTPELKSRLTPELTQEEIVENYEQTAFETASGPAPDLVPEERENMILNRSELVTDIDIGIPESRAQEICMPVTNEINQEDAVLPGATPPPTPAVEPSSIVLETPSVNETPIAADIPSSDKSEVAIAAGAAVAVAAAATAAVAATTKKPAMTKKSPTTPTTKTPSKPAPKTSIASRTPASATKTTKTPTTVSRTPTTKTPSSVAKTTPAAAKSTTTALSTAPATTRLSASKPGPKTQSPRTAVAKSPSALSAAKEATATAKSASTTRAATALKAAPKPAAARPVSATAAASKPARPAVSAPSKPREPVKLEKKPLANGDVKPAASKPTAGSRLAAASKPAVGAAKPAPRPAPAAPRAASAAARPASRPAAPARSAATTTGPATARSAVPKSKTGAARPPLDKQSKDLANKRITAKTAPPRTAATKAPPTKSTSIKTAPKKSIESTKEQIVTNGIVNGDDQLTKPPATPPPADNALLPDVIA